MSLLPGARKFTAGGAGPAPTGYQGGSGRGATPFTTRADLGGGGSVSAPPAASGAPPGWRPPAGRGRGSGDAFGAPPPGYIPGRGRGATGFSGGVSRDDTMDDRGDYSDANFDEFSGYSEGLFRDGEYDEEDRQADVVYDAIEERMDARRKSRRETKLKEELAKMRAEKPTIHQQFADIKRSLSTVTREEWESIPDIGDYTLKRKQAKTSSITPAPDSLLFAARAQSQSVGSIGSRIQQGLGGGATTPIGLGLQTPLGLRTPMGLQTPLGLQTSIRQRGGVGGGFQTPMSGSGGATPSLNDLGEARGTVLSVKLDKVMDNVAGQTVIDPKGYLTDLNSMTVVTDADIADVKKARLLLKSVIQTNPKHAPGWIAAARLEEIAGRLQTARELIAQGCSECPKNEDVWLEATRLEKPAEAKAVLANGIKVLPHSVRLWLEAATRETDEKVKKLVLRKALQFIPNSVRLWKEAVSLEDPAAARVMLSRAVECVPQSVDMWLALAKLSDYHDAQRVLNEARKQIPTNSEIWVTAAKLEESNDNGKMVDTIISRGIDNLTSKGVTHDRDNWLGHAEESEKSGFPLTCQAIVKATMKIGVEGVNAKRIWKDDARGALTRGCVITARTLYAQALEHVKTSKGLWMALAQLEGQYGNPDALDEVLQKAVINCPAAETLWLMAAKQKWIRGDVPAARRILAEAFNQNLNVESISLAAVKLEKEVEEFERARMLLKRARPQCSSERVWMQSVQLERMLGNFDEAKSLVEEAIQIFPKFSKLWMIYGHLFLEQPTPDPQKAIATFERGRRDCPKSVPLWLCAIDCHRQAGNWIRARALLEEARLKNPNNDALWLAAVDIELEAAGVTERDLYSALPTGGNIHTAHRVMAKALQECPKSGPLWAKAIFLEPKNAQNAKSVDALTQCENDAHVILSVARLFWRDKKVAKARRWLNRALTLSPQLGDGWGAFLAFELQNGTTAQQKDVINRCTQAEPNRGQHWNKIVKRVENWRLKWPEKLQKFVEIVYPEIAAQARKIADTAAASDALPQTANSTAGTPELKQVAKEEQLTGAGT